MRPQFDADAAQHEQPEHHHQGQVEAAETRSVKQREREIERAAGSQQPDFIAIPNRANGAHNQFAAH